tara:strand:- start:6117 stop:7553 length:1437 start_codon:yes stop_codon:yes gene_type:complete
MTRKSKFYLFIFILAFLILIILGFINVGKESTNPFINSIKLIVPEKAKIYLKKTIFILPDLISKIEKNRTKIKELEEKIAELTIIVDSQINGFNILEDREIKSKLNTYSFKTFKLPYRGWLSGSNWIKPTAYIEQTNDKIIIVSGNGKFFSFNKKNLDSDSLKIEHIKSNIKSLISDEQFYKNSSYSIKDLFILDNDIFFSYSKQQTKNCYNTTIISAELNYDYLQFSEFFSYEDCVSKDENGQNRIDGYRSGGRMVSFKDGKILLTTGDYLYRPIAQNKDSIFGKIISIDLQTKDYEIIAMGIRNSQGLYYDRDKDIIIFTDHGPKGGDEININFSPDKKIVENYGWPISSYGEHYDGKSRNEAPLHKSHKDYGFIEPIKYFTKRIAISEIIKVPQVFNKKSTNGFFIGALGYKSNFKVGGRSIHHIQFDNDLEKIIFEDLIPIGDRVRDMVLIKEKNIVLMILEDIPSVGILKLME